MEEPWSLSYVHPELIHKGFPNGALVDDGSHHWQSQLEWTSSHQRTNSGWGCSSCFVDEPKTHSLPLPRDFSGPFSAPKFSLPTYFPPSYLPPLSYLPHLISCSFHLQSSGKLLSLSSIEFRRDFRHKDWGRWRAQRWRNMERRKQESISSQMKKQKRKVSSLLFLHFFFLWFFFLCVYLFIYILLENKKMSRKKLFKIKGQNRSQKWEGRMGA